jgi:hypothetical protein
MQRPQPNTAKVLIERRARLAPSAEPVALAPLPGGVVEADRPRPRRSTEHLPSLSGHATTRSVRPRRVWPSQAASTSLINQAARTDGVYALATNLPGRLSANRVLELYKGQQIVERRHRDYKQTLKVRPIFLHNDDRIMALTSIVGLALLIFGLIESQTRQALSDTDAGQLPGLPPEGRAAKPTARNILTAFQGLGITYTPTGIRLDRLTHTQRRILKLLEIQPPWPEHDDHARLKCGRVGGRR